MKALREPSLARRVVLALLAAFALVWLVLLARDYAGFKLQTGSREPIRGALRALAAALDLADANRAVTVMQATEIQYNQLRRNSGMSNLEDLLFRLERPDGTPIYASTALGNAIEQPMAADPQTVLVGTRRYWKVAHDTAHWRLTLLEPAVADTTALQWLGRGLVQPMLIAFPFVLLPLWIAVRRGLRPLRDLAARVAARPADDFSPLGIELRHAELKPLAEAFDALLARSRDSIARERAFVQDAAHELRTPLAVIAAQAHALSAATSDEDRAPAREALERAIARASHLTHQLLTLARLEGGQAPDRAAVNLVEVAQRMLIDAEPAARARDIELTLESPDRLDAALDTAAVHSILENLIGNAIHYGAAGGRVAVRLQVSADVLSILVTDDGPGIPENQRAHMFERFRRGTHDAVAGTGLGLAIVRQAATRLGGRVDCADGIDGRGIGFHVRLPIDGETSTPARGGRNRKPDALD